MAIAAALSPSPASTPPATSRLGHAPVGFRGVIRGIQVPGQARLPPEELERRLVELGFVEGAQVEILHQGLIGRDPIAVRVGGTTIALRRSEAAAVLVNPPD